jgi:hypothetical protein
MERTRQEVRRADVVLAVHCATDTEPMTLELPEGATRLDVYNKSDLAPGFAAPARAIAVSAKTGAGLPELRRAILQAAGWSATGESVFLARERHLRALTSAAEHLRTEGRYVGSGPAAVRAAEVRHGDYFAGLDEKAAIADACAELDNLVVACRRAAARGDVDMAVRSLEGAWAGLSLRGPFDVESGKGAL